AGRVGLRWSLDRTPTCQRGEAVMTRRSATFLGWPALRQLASGDLLGRGAAVTSRRTREVEPRTSTADRVVQSVCPYCAVGCGQKVFVSGERVVQIEGDPDSPVSRGRLCPKGAASEQLVNSPSRQTQVLYRAPGATQWQPLEIGRASCRERVGGSEGAGPGEIA